MTRASPAIRPWIRAAGWCLLLLAALARPAAAETGGPSSREEVAGQTGGPPVGLYFHSGIPTAIRKLIVDDLVWLARQPSFRNSQDLAAALGYPGELLDGRRLVAWFLQRVRFVARSDFCPFQSLVIVDDHRPAWLRFSGVNARCNPSDSFLALMYGGDRWRRAARTGREVDGAYVDQRVLLHPRSSGADFPGMFLNLERLARIGYRDDIPPDALAPRVYRLIPLLHEARHFDGYGHGSCGELYLGTRAIRFSVMTTGSDQKGVPVCDESTWGAQGLTGAFARMIAETCDRCTPSEQRDIFGIASDQWRRVAVPLRRPWKLGDLAAKSGTRGIPRDLVEAVVDGVPHAAFFTALRDMAVAEGRPCRARDTAKSCVALAAMKAEVDALIAMFTAAERAGEFTASWSGLSEAAPVTPPDLAGATEWLALVERAAEQDYNVPGRWLMSCDELAIGCPSRGRPVDFRAITSEMESGPPIVFEPTE